MSQKLFEYAVLHHPKPTKEQRESGETVPSELIVSPTPVLAKDDKVVALQAARMIPEKYADRLDQVEIIVRPF